MMMSSTWNWFCGKNSSVPRADFLNSACEVNTCIALTQASFIVLFSAVLLCFRHCSLYGKQPQSKYYVFRLPGHVTRWILTFIILVVDLLMIAEGVLTNGIHKQYGFPNQPHLYIPAALLTVSSVMSLVYYHMMEKWRADKMILLLLLYWLSSLVSVMLKLVYLSRLGLASWQVFCFDLMTLAAALFTAMLFLETTLLYRLIFRRVPSNYQPTVPLSSSDSPNSMRYSYKLSTLLSAVTYWWLNWLFKVGYRKPIEPADLGTMPECHTSTFTHCKFKENFTREKTRAQRTGSDVSIYRVYWRTYATTMLLGYVLKLLGDAAHFVSPFCISGIILYVTASPDDLVEPGGKSDEYHHYVTANQVLANGFILVGFLFVASVLMSVFDQSCAYCCFVEAVHVRSAIQSMVYEKSLRLSSYAITGGLMTTGQITNHMSIDAANIQGAFKMGIEMLTIPVKIGVILYLLYCQLGVPSLIGASLFIIIIPIQLFLAGLKTKYDKEIMIHADERMNMSSEMLKGMKLLKLYGWERLYCDFVKSARGKELNKLWKAYSVEATNWMINTGVPVAVKLVSFGIFSKLTGKDLTPDVAFSSLYLFYSLVDPMFTLPYTVSLNIAAYVSSNRIQAFLLAPEVDRQGLPDANEWSETSESNFVVDVRRKWTINESSPREDDSENVFSPFLQTPSKDGNVGATSSNCASSVLPEEVAIKVINGTFTWDPESSRPCLQDINVDIPRGKLTIVAGSVGSGKSSLLEAILGEMTTLHGQIQIRKDSRVAYAPQKAWLMNRSLKENITFGRPYKHDRYRDVIEACALDPDIAFLPDGDETEIGEKGINLSGGQKQRVSVARAMYSDNEIVILDDPLSALDAHVGRHLFEAGIMGILKRQERTVILVTHQLRYLARADKVIVMKEGRIFWEGTPDKLEKVGPSFTLDWQGGDFGTDDDDEGEPETSGENIRERGRSSKMQVMEISSLVDSEKGRLITREDQEKGSVSYRIYWYYLRAVSKLATLVLFAALLITSGLEIATNFWLAEWSDASTGANFTQETHDNDYFISVYAAFSGMHLFFNVLCIVSISVGIYHAAKSVHMDMLDNVASAPMRFFDTTPAGRILNRFSNDTQLIDKALLISIRTVIFLGANVISSLVVVVAVSPYFILFVIPVAIVFVLLIVYYISTSRELQRCMSVTRSPVFAHFSETLDGLSTIRAFRMEKDFFQTVLDRILINNKTSVYMVAAQRWIIVRLDFLGAVTVLFASLFSLLGALYFGLEASYVGLAISYSLQISLYMDLCLNAAAAVELQMNAVERVKYYAEVPTENYTGVDPPSTWPQNGEIELKGISARYHSTLDAVLNDITLSIPSRHKLGICGRTGSGKSSLTLALLRIIDTFKGRILIDGVDIASVPLLTLRQRVSIIPQDPFLFTGSIRNNLDPLKTKEDDDLWHALEIAQLADVVRQLDQGLDSQVTEGGQNFSMGQRQLFCLARAFLRKSKIVIMDEATASVDHETDQVLQDVVQDVFRDHTVITIAHRVGTISSCDKILTLSDGRVIECDSPENLLETNGSVFRAFVQAGK
ncbi:ATP-binding cassette sub-family C member 8-like [Diadema antillarum]|uniref:ATP-binding cassette sub-family C member 8-like n=1 Tax=Diadema antillarum TaxID=105358 RepID=UPI003A89EB1B